MTSRSLLFHPSLVPRRGNLTTIADRWRTAESDLTGTLPLVQVTEGQRLDPALLLSMQLRTYSQLQFPTSGVSTEAGDLGTTTDACGPMHACRKCTVTIRLTPLHGGPAVTVKKLTVKPGKTKSLSITIPRKKRSAGTEAFSQTRRARL